MKTILTILLLLSGTSLTAQKKPLDKKTAKREVKLTPRQKLAKLRAAIKQQQNDYQYVIKYVLDPKIKENEKKIPTLKKKVDFYKRKLRAAKTGKSKKIYKEKLLIEESKLQKFLLWKHYKKYYKLQNEAYIQSNTKLYDESGSYLEAISAKYKEIVAKNLPDPEDEFYKSKLGIRLLAKRKANK